MRKFLIIALSVIGLYSCKQELIISEAEIGEDLLYINNKITPYTGKCKVVYNDSKSTKEIFSFRKGRLNGDAVYYYKNGKLKWKGEYKEGNIAGKWEFWNENGMKIYEVHYDNDTLDGNFISWYSSGKVKEQGSYKLNKKSGKWITYDEKGTILESQMY